MSSGLWREIKWKSHSKKTFKENSPKVEDTITRMWNYIRNAKKVDVFKFKTKKELVDFINKIDKNMAKYFKTVPKSLDMVRSMESVFKTYRKRNVFVGKTAEIRKYVQQQKIRNKNVLVRKYRNKIFLYSNRKRRLGVVKL